MDDLIERHLAGPLAGDFEDIDAVFLNGPRQSGKRSFSPPGIKTKTAYATR
jgi:hypothetical protein